MTGFLESQTADPQAESLVDHSVLFHLSLLAQYHAEVDDQHYPCKTCNILNPPDNLVIIMIVESNRPDQANLLLHVSDLHSLITWTNTFTQKMKSLMASANTASCAKPCTFEAGSGHSEIIFF